MDLCFHHIDMTNRAYLPPFDTAEGFEFRDWWSSSLGSESTLENFSVNTIDGEEVARVALAEMVELGRQIEGDSSALLEIAFLDVKEDWQNRGIGTEIVSRLSDLYPESRLLARSLRGSEYFWARLGWQPYEPRVADGSVLFVAPARA